MTNEYQLNDNKPPFPHVVYSSCFHSIKSTGVEVTTQIYRQENHCKNGDKSFPDSVDYSVAQFINVYTSERLKFDI